MKKILFLTIFAACTAAQADICTQDFSPGYDCQTTEQNQTLLVLHTMRPDHGVFVCERETVANFGSHAEECRTAAQALIYGVK